ncbi:hypothetical protein PSL92_20020, partial [Clostridioides difficile]|uniref:hypothetical protein n=1 Tax=Clostridioides difficile TaxID=1496 RepID=UPI0023581E43
YESVKLCSKGDNIATLTLDKADENKVKLVAKEDSYMISQTPQVWLDFQTYVVNGELILCWDVVDELYHEGMIDSNNF